jgi:integrase
MGLGAFPKPIGLADARAEVETAAGLITKGIDPIEQRRAHAQAKTLAAEAEQVAAATVITFKQAAEDYIDAHGHEWKGKAHAAGWRYTMLDIAVNGMDCEKHGRAQPIGDKPVLEITRKDAIALLRPLWAFRNETAKRTRQRAEAVLNWAVDEDDHPRWSNPFERRAALLKKLPGGVKKKQRKAVPQPALALADVPAFMGKLAARTGMAAAALEFGILTATRSTEYREARWSEISNLDGEAPVWSIPAKRMKAGEAHQVPLSGRAAEVLKALPRMAGEDLIFWTSKGKAVSSNAVLALCKDLSVEVAPTMPRAAVPHGWRSTFRDWAGELTEHPRELCEFALAHAVDGVEARYRRLRATERRVGLMEDWAQFLVPPEPEGDNVVRPDFRKEA